MRIILVGSDDQRERLRAQMNGHVTIVGEFATLAAARAVTLDAAAIVLAPRVTTAPESLTAREHEVLELMAEGASNASIGTALVISQATVKSHVRQILRKLGASNRTEAVSLFLAAGRRPAIS